MINFKIVENHLKVAFHRGGALVVEVALFCIASPSILQNKKVLTEGWQLCRISPTYLKIQFFFEIPDISDWGIQGRRKHRQKLRPIHWNQHSSSEKYDSSLSENVQKKFLYHLEVLGELGHFGGMRRSRERSAVLKVTAGEYLIYIILASKKYFVCKGLFTWVLN